MTDRPRVGFVGLGDMGGPMARHIIEAGFPTTLWARRASSLAPYDDLSFHAARDLVELGRRSDIVGLCVFADADVREVMLGEAGLLAGMAPGGVVIVHATITVETAREVAAAGAAKGVAVLDAPVSGARVRSIEGTLAIMVGGDPAAFENALPVMRTYGESIRLMGPVGSGQTMKVLNNVLGFANLRMAHLAIETGARLGLDPEAVMATLRVSSGGSFNLNILIDRLLPDPAFARHAVTMTEKDTRIFQGICASSGIERTVLDDIAEQAITLVRDLGKRP